MMPFDGFAAWITPMIGFPGLLLHAIALTASSQAAVTAAKIVARNLKRMAWDERSTAARFGLGGAALGLAAFGSQGAGIAALGTAVGVPLWVVSGAGASMAGVLLEELKRKKS